MNPNPRGSMLLTRLRVSTLFSLLLMASALSWNGVALASPEATVEAVNQDVLEILQTRGADLEDDPALVDDLIDEVIVPYIDFDTMARMVLGRYWRTASDAQRLRFTTEFRGFLVRFYSAAVREYIIEEGVPEGISVKVLGLREPPKTRTARVRSEILQPGRPAVSVAYTLYQKDDQWKVVDLQFESVSMVINYRHSFASQIKTAGLDALIETLAEKNRQAHSA